MNCGTVVVPENWVEATAVTVLCSTTVVFAAAATSEEDEDAVPFPFEKFPVGMGELLDPATEVESADTV